MYDMKAIFMISTLINGINITTLNNIADAWNDNGINMLYHLEKIKFGVACYWQLTINRRVLIDSPDRETNDWIYLLLINTCTPRLREQINTKYKALDHCFRGPITYTWLLFQLPFSNSRDSTSLLLKFIDIFTKKGLMR